MAGWVCPIMRILGTRTFDGKATGRVGPKARLISSMHDHAQRGAWSLMTPIACIQAKAAFPYRVDNGARQAAGLPAAYGSIAS